jgi:hypothetical protein
MAITAIGFSAPLSGTYTINSSLPTGGTNFASFNAASDSLSINGVSGPVLILVNQGTYTEQLIIGNITGTSATNTITFKANPSNTAVAKIEYNAATSNATNYVIRFSNATHIIVDSIEISSTTGATYGKLVDYINSNSFITFKNNTLYGSRNLSNSDEFSIFFENTGTTNVSNDLTFDNNKIYGGSNAFYINSTGSAHQSNFLITNNTIMYPSDYGVFTNECSNVQVIGNYIEDDTNRNTTLHAIYLTYSDSASDIKANNIRINSGLAHTYGIRATYVYGTAINPVHIENNMVNMVGLSTSKLHYGIDIANGFYQNIYHNTINVNSSSGTLGRGIYISASSGAGRGKTNIVNNIFYNSQGSYALYTSSSNADFYIDSLDHNVYYSTGTPFLYNGTNYSTLAAFQAASGKDRNSLFGDPGFVSSTDLHLVGTLANNVGDNSIGVMTDIDGQIRPFGSTTVDIGADEYSLSTCPPLSAISRVEIRNNAATITWLSGPNDVSWIVEYGLQGFNLGTGVVTNSITDTFSIIGLLASTCYDVYVKSVCSSDTSNAVGPFNFCTPCAPFSIPFLEDFTNMSAVGPLPCWEESKGLLSANSILTPGYTAWTLDDFGNQTGLGIGSARCELGYTNINEWLISPLIDLGNGTTDYQLEFEIAVTSSNNSSAPIGGTIALDDKIVVLISTDYGSTWSTSNILRQWDSTDIPLNTGELFFYNLTAAGYSGVVQFAIYTESTINNARNEVHIDDFRVVPAPTCPSPTMLSYVSSSLTSASVNWIDGVNDVSWELEHGVSGFTPGTGTATAITTSGTGTIFGLTSSTLYDVYLRSICVSGDSSMRIGPLKLQTLCGTSGDFCENFDNFVDSNNLPACWGKYINSTDANALIISNNDVSNSHLTDYSVVMSNSFDVNSIFMLTTPELIDITAGTHRINFWAKEQGSSGLSKLVVGTASDPNNPGTLNPIDTFSLTTAYSFFQLDLTNYTGIDTRIAFYFETVGTRDRVYIDEVCWEPNVSCEKVISGALLNVGQDSTSLDIGWNPDTAKVNYIVSYGSTGYVPGVGTELGSISTPSNFLTFIGLSPITEYCFWIKAICTSGDTSFWSGPHCGMTGCPEAFTTPYAQDFTEYIPVCWEEKQGILKGSGTSFTNQFNSSWINRQFGNQGADFGASLQVYGSSVDEWLISPSIDFGSNSGNWKLVEFDYSLTDYISTTNGTLSSDDSIVLVASYDNGITWDTSGIIGLWDANNPIAPGRNRFSTVIKNKTGKVKIGIYGRSTSANNNTRFHIDNFLIRDTIANNSGIKELFGTKNFTVFPNPNNGEFYILNSSISGDYLVTVMDTKGRVMHTKNAYLATKDNERIFLENVTKGIYLVQIQSKNNIEQHSVVVQ